jgi:hypothetical protein
MTKLINQKWEFKHEVVTSYNSDTGKKNPDRTNSFIYGTIENQYEMKELIMIIAQMDAKTSIEVAQHIVDIHNKSFEVQS